MSRNRLGVAAAIILAMAATSAATVAAPKKGAEAAAPGTISDKDRERGKAEAPAVATAAGLTCGIVDARFIIADPKSKISYYEIACDQGIGYIVFADPAKPTPTAAPCFEANKPIGDKPSPLACRLPGNLDLQAQLAPYVAKTGVGCTITKSRYIGASPTKTFIEIACQEGGGDILILGAPANLSADAELSNCLNYEAGGTVACELTDRATQLAVVDTLVAGSGKACAVKDKRYVLSTKSGTNWFEVSCQDGSGYMLEQAATGALARAVQCADADFVGGGCTMTDARASKTEQNGLYSRLAGKAGFACDVERYGVFNVPGKEVVELKCKDRPDGAIADFSGATGIVYNCAVSEAQGYRCSFSEKGAAAYAQVTKDLKSLKETTCVVRETRAMDKATDNAVYIEANCSDGNGSYVIGYQKGGTKPLEALACSQAKSLGGCKLPGN